MLAPFILYLAIFAAYPFYRLVELSLSTVEVSNGKFVFDVAGFQNYLALLNEPSVWRTAGINVVFMFGAVTGSMVAGILGAFLVDRSRYLGKLAQNVFIWPAVVTPVVVSVAWLLILHPTVGGLNKVLTTLGLPGQEVLNSETSALITVVLVDMWHWTPIVFLFVYTALKGLDTELLAAARVDGASEWQVRWHIALPLLLPTILGVTAVRLIQTTKAFDEVYVLTGGGPNGATELLSLEIRRLFFDQTEYGLASALSVVLILIVAIVALMAALLRRAKTKGAGS